MFVRWGSGLVMLLDADAGTIPVKLRMSSTIQISTRITIRVRVRIHLVMTKR